MALAAAAALAVGAAVCPIEHAQYRLRHTPSVTAHFERAPLNADWPSGLAIAVHGAKSGQTTYWLPWSGGTDNGRHMRLVKTVLSAEAETAVDMDLFTLDVRYDFASRPPMFGDSAPAHLLIPNLNLWYGGNPIRPRDASPRAFFDLVGCHRSTATDRGATLRLPRVP